jgi:hypothetical protein
LDRFKKNLDFMDISPQDWIGSIAPLATWIDSFARKR